jgi:putative methionine-R-sulfoxide reductase with GAF domain
MTESADAQALGALSRFLISDSSVGETLQRVVDITARTVTPAAFVGISMLDDRDRVTTAVHSDVQATEIDQPQYDAGRGPCLDSWRTRTVVRVDDVAGDGLARYPEFSRACLDRGDQEHLLLAAGRR